MLVIATYFFHGRKSMQNCLALCYRVAVSQWQLQNSQSSNSCSCLFIVFTAANRNVPIGKIII
ncbi:hypothetical protein E4K63_06595 [Allofrancisella inopinata]|uniref:Uncharacterized protein n=1 Tax=Allofrancisella inopinata TaxID=1085647 RepID=A0AAE6YIH8_9GAMM|nr:hypothetical protein E4K63_06595 [Allofrancisella inopinata]